MIDGLFSASWFIYFFQPFLIGWGRVPADLPCAEYPLPFCILVALFQRKVWFFLSAGTLPP